MVTNSRQEVDLRWATTAIDRKFNASATANTNIFTSNLTPTEDVSIFRITVSEDTGRIFRLRITRSGTTVSTDFNSGVALTADTLNTFDIPVRSDTTYNFQFNGATTIHILQIDELVTEAT